MAREGAQASPQGPPLPHSKIPSLSSHPSGVFGALRVPRGQGAALFFPYFLRRSARPISSKLDSGLKERAWGTVARTPSVWDIRRQASFCHQRPICPGRRHSSGSASGGRCCGQGPRLGSIAPMFQIMLHLQHFQVAFATAFPAPPTIRIVETRRCVEGSGEKSRGKAEAAAEEGPPVYKMHTPTGAEQPEFNECCESCRDEAAARAEQESGDEPAPAEAVT